MLSYSFESALEEFKDSGVWTNHAIVPDDIVQVFKETHGTRVIATINQTVTIHCALLSTGKGQHYILLNKEVRKKIGALSNQILKIKLEPDNSKYGMKMPEEFSSLLEIDEEGSQLFHNLTPGKQRALIHLVAKHKKEETKISKALTILNYLKNAHGKLDFKDLNAAFKNAIN